MAEGTESGGGSRAFAGQAMPHFWMVAPEMSSLVCKSLSSCALMKGHLSEYPCISINRIRCWKVVVGMESSQDTILCGKHQVIKAHCNLVLFGGEIHTTYIQSRKYLENRGKRPAQVKGEKLPMFPLPLSTLSEV